MEIAKSAGGTAVTAPQFRRLLDMSATDVQHYGLKFGVEYNDPTGSLTAGKVNMRIKYYVTCKHTR
jgi:hypothetical protein